MIRIFDSYPGNLKRAIPAAASRMEDDTPFPEGSNGICKIRMNRGDLSLWSLCQDGYLVAKPGDAGIIQIPAAPGIRA